jgi:hypothetical protein
MRLNSQWEERAPSRGTLYGVRRRRPINPRRPRRPSNPHVPPLLEPAGVAAPVMSLPSVGLAVSIGLGLSKGLALSIGLAMPGAAVAV